MKKNYFFTLLLILCFSVFSSAQDLIITGAFDGPNSGGTPKGVELFVANDIADLSIYGIGSANNGGGTDGEEFTFPADAVTAGTFIYVASEDTQFTAFFGFAPTYNAGSAMGINGDDAVELFKNGSVIDTFGDIAKDGTGEAWDHVDGWAYRKDGTGPDGGFVLANWTFSGTNQLEGGATNAATKSPFPAKSYKTTASTTPSLAISSPKEGATLSATTTINLLIGVTNFNVAAGGTGDGYIKWKINGVAQSDKFNVDDEAITVAPGNSYTIFMELVDNSGNPIVPNVTDTVMFSVELPCNLQLGAINTTCDVLTTGTDGFSGSIAFNDGNTGVTYTITAPNGVTIGGDDPSTVSSGTITFSGMTEGTNAEIKIVGDATSSCDFTRTLFSPTCIPFPIEETFNYNVGSTLISSNLWQDGSTSSTPNDISLFANNDGNGNPVLGNYYNSSQFPDPTGNFVKLSGPGSDPYRAFTGTNSGTIYASFLFQVTNMDNFKSNANGGYFVVLAEPGGSFKTRLWLKDITAGGLNEGLTYQIGISNNGTAANVVYPRNSSANIAEPVFVVIAYDFSNDSARLWINPDATSFGADIPPASTASSLATGNDIPNSLGRFLLRQDSSSETPSIDFDELRIGTKWSQIAPSGATASVLKNSINGFASYPNPVTNGKLFISSHSSDDKEIVIYNLIGKKVFETSFSGTNSELSVSNLNSGLYVLKVTEAGKTATKKLVIR